MCQGFPGWYVFLGLASATTPISSSTTSKSLLLERLFCVRAEYSPLFFEHPLRNPFNHEERFRIDLDDHQLRVVTGTSEWAYLRRYAYDYNRRVNFERPL